MQNELKNRCYFIPQLMKNNNEEIQALENKISKLENEGVTQKGIHVIERGGDNQLGYQIWSDGLIENWGYVTTTSTVQFLKSHTQIPTLTTSMDMTGTGNITASYYVYNLTTSSIYLLVNSSIKKHSFKTIGY